MFVDEQEIRATIAEELQPQLDIARRVFRFGGSILERKVRVKRVGVNT